MTPSSTPRHPLIALGELMTIAEDLSRCRDVPENAPAYDDLEPLRTHLRDMGFHVRAAHDVLQKSIWREIAAERELEELHATLAAERGEANGALPGWRFETNDDRDQTWRCETGAWLLIADNGFDGTWTAVLYETDGDHRWERWRKPCPTAREAMRAVDAHLAGVEKKEDR